MKANKTVYTELILDPVILKKYNEIQKVDTTSYYHGVEHIKNVISIMNKFISALNIESKTADKLQTAVIFHDIGRSNVGKDHDKKSAEYFIAYVNDDCDNSKLMQESFDANDIEEIANAILTHEEKENLDELTSFQLLVNLADKLDITKNRINLNGVVDENNPASYYREIYLDVDDVEIMKNENIISINIIGNENLSSERLFSIPFMKNMENVLCAFCKSINCDFVLSVNNETSRRSKFIM